VGATCHTTQRGCGTITYTISFLVDLRVRPERIFLLLSLRWDLGSRHFVHRQPHLQLHLPQYHFQISKTRCYFLAALNFDIHSVIQQVESSAVLGDLPSTSHTPANSQACLRIVLTFCGFG